jgi:gamma-glutamyl-gamma-aminobutyraldehyde dehydrogenase
VTAQQVPNYRKIATDASFETRAFIDGAFVDALSGKTFETVNPATGKTLARVAEGDAKDIDRAVKAARRAFERETWSGMGPRDRKKVLLRLADLIERDLTELAVMETLDCGKPIGDSVAVDLPDTI